MKPNKNIVYKNAIEISTLSSLLTPIHQSYVLNTIEALLFSQQSNIIQQDNSQQINRNKNI